MSREKGLSLLTHVIGWLLFFGLLAGFINNVKPGRPLLELVANPYFLLFVFVYTSLFYLNVGVLIPYFYLKGRYLTYFLILTVLLIAVYFIKPFDHVIHSVNNMSEMRPPPGTQVAGISDMQALPPSPEFGPPGETQGIFKTDIMSIVLFVMVSSLGLALCIIRQWRSTEQRALKAEAEKAYAELSFLKAQINPHFLFNTLNTIYAMVMVKNDKAADAVMKLSNIMRYITDEVSMDLVSLESEISCLNDYIELQRMRIGAKTQVEVTVTGETDNLQIAPLLLMTFVENAFKYGVSNHEPAVINIALDVQDPVIRFYCRNKRFALQSHNERNGIGINNARKRLDHLYPGRYKLDIQDDDGSFTVRLNIQS